MTSAPHSLERQVISSTFPTCTHGAPTLERRGAYASASQAGTWIFPHSLLPTIQGVVEVADFTIKGYDV
jgi:hypothetical protein